VSKEGIETKSKKKGKSSHPHFENNVGGAKRASPQERGASTLLYKSAPPQKRRGGGVKGSQAVEEDISAKHEKGNMAQGIVKGSMPSEKKEHREKGKASAKARSLHNLNTPKQRRSLCDRREKNHARGPLKGKRGFKKKEQNQKRRGLKDSSPVVHR